MRKNLAESVRVRLLNIAKVQDVDFNQILVHFALERILYRMSQSEHADHFLLKGALLFNIWYNMQHRATRDADLLGFGPSDLDSIAQTFREIASFETEDGITFDPTSVKVDEIRKGAGYAGARVLITAEIAKAQCKTQIDIGFGDAVTPGPLNAVYPVLIDEFPAPTLRIYPVHTVVAEKLHAIVFLGMTNSRLKDYFDLSILLERETLDTIVLAKAITATFARRGTRIPPTLPTGLSDEFSFDKTRQAVWSSFLKKNGLKQTDLYDIVANLRGILQPVLITAREMEKTV